MRAAILWVLKLETLVRARQSCRTVHKIGTSGFRSLPVVTRGGAVHQELQKSATFFVLQKRFPIMKEACLCESLSRITFVVCVCHGKVQEATSSSYPSCSGM